MEDDLGRPAQVCDRLGGVGALGLFLGRHFAEVQLVKNFFPDIGVRAGRQICRLQIVHRQPALQVEVIVAP